MDHKQKKLMSSILGSEEIHVTTFPEEDVDSSPTNVLFNPVNAPLSADTEDDDAFDTLLEEGYGPGEAAREVASMRPASVEEAQIEREMPDAGEFTRVDDAEHDAWLQAAWARGHKGMDAVLDDAVFGDTKMDHDEKLERIGRDSDIGFGWGSLKKLATAPISYPNKLLRKIPGVSRVQNLAHMPTNLARKALGSVVKAFVPSRDAGKAQIVRGLNTKLVTEHANWLGIQDQNAGRPVLSPTQYQAMSVPWAKSQIMRAGLPISTVVGRAEILGSDILGDDVIGAWWNPLSWFSNQAQVVVNNTQGARSPVGPDGQPVDPNAVNPDGTPMLNPDGTPATPDQYPPEDTTMQPSPYDQQYAPDGTQGDDLGSFIGQVLNPTAPQVLSPKGASPKADEVVARAVDKLRSGQGLAPGELALLATLAKSGHPRAKRVYTILLKEGTTSSGAWAYKLNPLYWLKPKEEKHLVDVEKEKWIENADLQKKIAKQKETLEQAEKAKAASDAVAVAKAQSLATEAQLKAISATLGDMLHRGLKDDAMGSFVGHEKPTAVSQVVSAALAKAGKKDRAVELYGKIMRKEPLADADVKDLRTVAKILHQVKVVHGDLVAQDDPALALMHGAFVGACAKVGLDAAAKKSRTCAKIATALGAKLDAGEALSPTDVRAGKVLADTAWKQRQVVHSFASGAAVRGLDRAGRLRAAIIMGAAAAAMTPAEKQMVAALVKLAKAGNPRAAAGLARLRSTGAIVGGDHVGSFISDTFNNAMKPITMPAKYLYKGLKWTGQKLGIVSKGSPSAEQVRLAKIRAAAQRRKAAEARAAAADAQTEAELRAQQSIAASADAEAEAADAEALAKEAKMRTAEIEADPSMAATDDSEDTSGAFVGAWEAHVESGKDALAVKKAQEKSPAGMSVRAGARAYAKVKKGDPQAKKALKTMIMKSQKGDRQAKRDLNAMYAGMVATKARQKAQKKEERALAARARKAKVKAFQSRLEAAAANKVVRAERRYQIYKLDKVVVKARAGNPKARAYVKKQGVLAKQGDKRAQSNVKVMKLAAAVRKAAPTKRERRNVAAATHLVRKAKRGDRKATRQMMLVNAAAKAGNPNARRAKQRIEVAIALDTAITTGTIVGIGAKKKHDRQKAAAALAAAQKKQKSGTATREELNAGSTAAASLGDRKAAGELAAAAAVAPSATETLQRASSVVQAKEAGNADASAAIKNSLEAAKTGDPDAVRRTGNVVAAQTLGDINAGRPVPQSMKDAVALQERAAAGDPTAIDTVSRITEAATVSDPSPEATAAAVTLAAAAVTARAMAGKPKTREKYLEAMSSVPESDRPVAAAKLAELTKKAQDGSITAEEGVEAERLASGLGKFALAAKIAAQAPPAPETNPLSSLPESPLPPITGLRSLVREVVRAVTFSTRDPLQNYHEGVASRSRTAMSGAECGSGIGWSPFPFFKKNLGVILPAVAAASSSAVLATTLAAKAMSKSSQKPASQTTAAHVQETPTVSTPATSVPPKPATSVPPKAAAEDAKPNPFAEGKPNPFEAATSSGADETIPAFAKTPYFKQTVKEHADGWKLDIERMQKGDALSRTRVQSGLSSMPRWIKLHRESHDPEGYADNYFYWLEKMTAEQVPLVNRAFDKMNQQLSSPATSSGADRTFKAYVRDALQSKKMSKKDFNQALLLHVGDDASQTKKTAAGDVMLKFLTAKGVKVG